MGSNWEDPDPSFFQADASTSEPEWQQENRHLRILSTCIQMMLHAVDEPSLLQELCRRLVETGQYQAAWVTLTDAPAIVHAGAIPLPGSPALSLDIPQPGVPQPLGQLHLAAPPGYEFTAREVQLFQAIAQDLTQTLLRLRAQFHRQTTEATLRASEARYRAFLAMASEAVIISNARGEIVIFNAKAEELFGYQASEILGQRIEYLIPERFRAGHLQFRAGYARHPVSRPMGRSGTLYAQRKDGSEFPIAAGLSTIEVEADRFVLTVLTDISDRQQTELALQQLNEELEQRVRDRTSELEALNQQLQLQLQEREQTQKQLAEQAQILDLAHDPIITRNPQGTITFWNRGAERTYGWSQAEAVGQSSHTLLQTQFPIPYTQIYTELLTHRYWEGELIHQRRDGSTLIVASRWVLQEDDQGQPVKVLEINNDITSTKQAEAVQARLAAIIESSDDAIVSTTLDSIITSWNRGAEKLYGYTASEIVGRSTTVLLPGDRLYEEAQILQRLQQGERLEHYETVRRHKNGQLMDVALTISPLTNAARELIGMSKIARDITRRKQAEAQLQLSNERISLANAELARASRLKDEFLAGMSHELRTPLNAILGISEALLEEIFGELTPEQREHLATIEQSGKHLLALINDILDLSKVESGKMELEVHPVLMQELCDSSLSFIKQQAHHKRIKTICRIDPELIEVELDERRIRQVLVNLLSNAVKFTPEGGRVELRVRADSLHDTIEFSITDTGIGIAPENISKLFQPFVQLDSSLSRRYAGTGLGLALVRRIVELHGGSVTLESQEGKGSRFIVTLPWQPFTPEQERPDPSASIEASPQLHQALIVEDSAAAANQVARYLGELGAKALVHSIGGGTTEVAAQLNPDVILLDVLLPDRSGWDVLADLKTNPVTQAIPVIVVSVVDERSKALELGATAYLLKPITRLQLQQTLTQVLNSPAFDQEQTALILAAPSLPQILLVEDNEANITTLKGYLKRHGFQILLARNGLEAIQMAKQHQPDAILMDIQMPDMDGLEATRRIHQDPDLQHIPIIALTALAMPGDRDRCLSAGAVDYLTKPVSLKHLLSLLAHHLPQASFLSPPLAHEP